MSQLSEVQYLGVNFNISFPLAGYLANSYFIQSENLKFFRLAFQCFSGSMKTLPWTKPPSSGLGRLGLYEVMYSTSKEGFV